MNMQRLNTFTLEDLTTDEANSIAAKTGNKLHFEVRKSKVLGIDGKVITSRVRTPIITNNHYLKLDTLIDTEKGVMTLEEFWAGAHCRLRCQATLRESTSMNGILGLHSDFSPFLFDNGTRIKYVLPSDVLRRRMPDVWITRLSNMTQDEVLEQWTGKLFSMDTGNRRRVLEWVHSRTGRGLRELSAALKEAESNWEQKIAQAANDNLLDSIDTDGRAAIIYEEAKLPEILLKVENAVFANSPNDLMLTHTQGLVTVSEKRPTTVREVIREGGASGQKNALGLLISRYGQYELGLRLMASCTFLMRTPNGRLKKIAPPAKLGSVPIIFFTRTASCDSLC